MLGSESRWRKPCRGFIGTSIGVAVAVASVTSSPPATVTVRPSAATRTSSIVEAIPSTAPAATASTAE